LAKCVDCELGKYRRNSVIDEALSCVDCGSGKYSDYTGAVSCLGCDPGKFGQKPGYASCADCYPGTYNNAIGSNTCEDCIAGMYTNMTGANFCVGCSAGKYGFIIGANSSLSCTDCAVGQYMDSEGADACTNCAPGRYGEVAGGESATSCVECTRDDIQGNSPAYLSCWDAPTLIQSIDELMLDPPLGPPGPGALDVLQDALEGGGGGTGGDGGDRSGSGGDSVGDSDGGGHSWYYFQEVEGMQEYPSDSNYAGDGDGSAGYAAYAYTEGADRSVIVSANGGEVTVAGVDGSATTVVEDMDHNVVSVAGTDSDDGGSGNGSSGSTTAVSAEALAGGAVPLPKAAATKKPGQNTLKEMLTRASTPVAMLVLGGLLMLVSLVLVLLTQRNSLLAAELKKSESIALDIDGISGIIGNSTHGGVPPQSQSSGWWGGHWRAPSTGGQSVQPKRNTKLFKPMKKPPPVRQTARGGGTGGTFVERQSIEGFFSNAGGDLPLVPGERRTPSKMAKWVVSAV
jgi:hypothetical protein